MPETPFDQFITPKKTPLDQPSVVSSQSTPFDQFIGPTAKPEDGYISGIARSAYRGVAEIGSQAGSAMQYNADYLGSGDGTPESRDQSKLNIVNKAGKFIADKSEQARDLVDPASFGDSEVKRAVFQGIESAPVSAAYAIPSYIGAGIGAASGLGTAGTTSIPGAIAGAVVGQAPSAAVMYRAQAQQASEDLDKLQQQGKLRDGVTNAEKLASAQKSGVAEFGGESLSDVAESVLFSRLPFLKTVATTAKGVLRPGLKEIAKTYAGVLAAEQLGEGGTAAAQTAAQNELLRPENQQSILDAVKYQAGPTTVMSTLMMGLGSAKGHLDGNAIAKKIESEATPPEERLQAANFIAGRLKETNGPEAAKNFLDHSVDAILNPATPNTLDLNDPALLQPSQATQGMNRAQEFGAPISSALGTAPPATTGPSSPDAVQSDIDWEEQQRAALLRNQTANRSNPAAAAEADLNAYNPSLPIEQRRPEYFGQTSPELSTPEDVAAAQQARESLDYNQFRNTQQQRRDFPGTTADPGQTGPELAPEPINAEYNTYQPEPPTKPLERITTGTGNPFGSELTLRGYAKRKGIDLTGFEIKPVDGGFIAEKTAAPPAAEPRQVAPPQSDEARLSPSPIKTVTGGPAGEGFSQQGEQNATDINNSIADNSGSRAMGKGLDGVVQKTGGKLRGLPEQGGERPSGTIDGKGVGNATVQPNKNQVPSPNNQQERTGVFGQTPRDIGPSGGVAGEGERTQIQSDTGDVASPGRLPEGVGGRTGQNEKPTNLPGRPAVNKTPISTSIKDNQHEKINTEISTEISTETNTEADASNAHEEPNANAANAEKGQQERLLLKTDEKNVSNPQGIAGEQAPAPVHEDAAGRVSAPVQKGVQLSDGNGTVAAQESASKEQTSGKSDGKGELGAGEDNTLDDFGEKIGGARKDMQRATEKEYSDDDIASMPLSKIWPKGEIDATDNKFVAAFSTAARAEIPRKPQKGYKLTRWVESVKLFRRVNELLVSGESRGASAKERVAAKIKTEFPSLEGFYDKVLLLESIPRDQWDRIGRVQVNANAYRFGEGLDKIPAPHVSVDIDGRYQSFDGAKSVEEIFDRVNDFLSAKEAPAATKGGMQFEVRGSGNSYSINKKGDPEYRELKTFASSKEAFDYRKEHSQELVAVWEAVKERDNVKKDDVRGKENRPRVGTDRRQGKDVSPETFMETFGFRGVEFGKWVSQGEGGKDRQGMLNQSFDALGDLADILGIPTKAVSLNGTLGLGLGSRGSGSASAHYEPGKLVINLTKTRGAGTLGHEFFHALDNYFQRERGVGNTRESSYITYSPETYMQDKKSGMRLTKARFAELSERRGGRINNPADWAEVPGVRAEVAESFADLVKVIDASPMSERAARIDKGKSEGYWSRIIERAARSFENYLIQRMMEKGYHNDYLANVKGYNEFSRSKDRYPYLKPEEIQPVAEAFDNLFSTIKTKETDKGVALYSTSPTQPSTQTLTPAQQRQVNRLTKRGMTESDARGNVFEKQVERELRDFLGTGYDNLVARGKLEIVRSAPKTDGTGAPLHAANNKVVGSYFPALKKIVLYSDNMAPGDAQFLALHEGAHALLNEDKIFRDRKQKILKDFAQLHTTSQAVRDAFKKVPADTAKGLRGEEALMYYLQSPSNHNHSIFRRVISAVKAALYRMGFTNMKLSESDLVALFTQGVKSWANRTADQDLTKGRGLNEILSGIGGFAQPVALSVKEAARKIQNLVAFKKWFGDSKVVDENGEPLVVYHGSHAVINAFKKTRGAHFGFHFGDQEAASRRLEDTADGRVDETERKRLNEIAEAKFNEWRKYEDSLRAKNETVPDDVLLKALESGEDIGPIFAQYDYKPTPQEAEKLAEMRDAYDRAKVPIFPLGVGSNIGAYYLAIKKPLRLKDVGNWGSTKNIKEVLPFESDARTLKELEEDIKSRGYDGIVYQNIVENPVMRTDSYIVFDSTQVKGIFNNQWDGTNPDILKSVQQGDNNDVRYSVASLFTGSIPRSFGLVQEYMNRPDVEERFENLASYLWDRDAAISRVQKEIGPQPETRDYNLLRRLTGKKVSDEIALFDRDKLKPLLKEMAAAKVKFDDVGELAWAEHAPERNLQMRRVNAKRYIDNFLQNFTDKEKEKYQERLGRIQDEFVMNDQTRNERRDNYIRLMDDLSVINEPAERQRIADMQAALDNRAFTQEEQDNDGPEKAQKRIDNATNRLEQRLEIAAKWNDVKNRLSGMTNEQAKAITDKWKTDGRYAGIRSVVDKMRAINEAALDMNYSAGELTEDEYNAIKNTYKFHVPLYREDMDEGKAPTGKVGVGPLASPIKIASGSTKKVVDIFPHIVDRYQAAINRKHKLEAGKILYEMVRDNPDESRWSLVEQEKKPYLDNEGNIRFYTDQQINKEVETQVKVDGKKYIIAVPKENKSMLRWMQALNREPVELGPMVKASRKVTQFLAALNTTASPEFLLTNFARDIQTAGIHLQSTEAQGMQGKVLKNIKSAIKGIFHEERGTDSGEWGAIYRDFAKNGGKISWMQGYENVEELAKNLESELAYEEGKKPLRSKYRSFAQFVGAMNTAVENGVRLATYKALLDSGATPRKAAHAAANLTVDFTRSGTVGPFMNSLFMFANAGIQGNVRMLNALAKNRSVQKIAAGIVGFGFAANILGAYSGGDDDDGEAYYDKLKRKNPDLFERNMVFMIPGTNGKHIKIPMPYGYNTMFVAGNEIASALRGGPTYKFTDGMARLGSALMGTFNPLGSATLLQTITPTVFDPVAMVMENKQWNGQALMPDASPFGLTKPDSERFFKSVNPIARFATQWINRITGGNENRSGVIDVSPETIDMIVETFTGSLGKLAKDSVSLPILAASGNLEMHKVPFARKVFGQKSDFVDSSVYRDNRDEIKLFEKEYDSAKPEDRRAMRDDSRYQLIEHTKETEKRLRSMRKRADIAKNRGDDSLAETIEGRMKNIYTEYNKRYNESK